ARVGRLSVDEREVRLLDAPGLERALERLKRRVVLGDDEAARGLLVEAVDDARPGHAADAGQSLHVVKERVDERPSCVACGRMDDEPGGLVEDEEIAVLVQDREREILGLGDRRLRRGNGDLERLPSLETERWTARAPIDEDPASLEQSLDPRAT